MGERSSENSSRTFGRHLISSGSQGRGRKKKVRMKNERGSLVLGPVPMTSQLLAPCDVQLTSRVESNRAVRGGGPQADGEGRRPRLWL